MHRQRRCCNLSPVFATWTHGVPEGIGLPGRRRRTPVERISPPTSPLLTRLVENSPLPLSRLHLPKRTRTTSKEVLGTKGADEDRVMAMTLLQRVSTPTPSRKKRKISLKFGATTVTRRDITLSSISKSQKTSVGLGDLHVGDWD